MLPIERHLRTCRSCRAAARDEGPRRQRFLTVAAARGFRFSADVYPAAGSAAGVSHRRAFWQGAAAASVVAAAAGLLWFSTASHRPAVPHQPQAVRTASLPQSSASKARDGKQSADLTKALEAAVARAREAERASAAKAAASDAARRASEEHVAALRRELADAGSASAAVQARLEAAEQTLAAHVTELRDARRQNASDAMMLDVQDRRLAALSAQVRESDERLDRQTQLLAANRDIRDLMGARNLHVIDVFDVDGRGTTRRAFGRAFYTEGKSLIFYAFDLSTAATRPASFQAWGQRENGTASALSLGLLYSDDQTQNRWTLKFEDASVLEQIDAMFVTVEPPGGSRSPRGRKLLYAYLRQKPNHP
jgi:hypothetical protein